MNERISDKIKEIEKYLQELETIFPTDFEEYEKDFKTRAACERYAERLIEALVDLAYLIIKDKKLELPENDAQSFDILVINNIISKDFAEKLKNAKGMRNILAHEYGEVNDEIVFHAITEELAQDAEEFIRKIKLINKTY